ncbi:MAG: ABC transporter permease [Acidobacteriota bacterium]
MIRVLRHLARYRSLLATLTRRELVARYRGSVLGLRWSRVNPRMRLVVYSFVFSTVFRPRDPSITAHGPYALFLACGVFPWTWLSTAWMEGTSALNANAGLIRKASFPAVLLPMVSVLSNLVHFVFAWPILILGFVLTGWFGTFDPATETGALLATFASEGIAWPALLVPLIALLHLPFISGLTLAFSALNVHFKDVKDILTNLVTLLFFMTPILYSLDMLAGIPLLQTVIAHSPFTPFFSAYQEVLFYGRVPEPTLWMQMVLIGTATWALGAALFDRLSETLVEAV